MTQSFISCELLLSFGFGSCCILSAGGMKTREDNDEELQNDQRRSRVWKLLRRVNSADLLPLLSSIGCHAMSPSTFCEQLMDGMRIWRTASGRAACSGYRPGLCFVRFRKNFFSWIQLVPMQDSSVLHDIGGRFIPLSELGLSTSQTLVASDKLIRTFRLGDCGKSQLSPANV